MNKKIIYLAPIVVLASLMSTVVAAADTLKKLEKAGDQAVLQQLDTSKPIEQPPANAEVVTLNFRDQSTVLGSTMQEEGKTVTLPLEQMQALLGEDHPVITVAIFNDFAIRHADREDYTQALFWLKQALDAAKKFWGEMHPETARAYNNLAIIYFRKNEYANASTEFESVLAIYETTQGKDSLFVGDTLKRLGITFYAMKNYPKAADYLKRALAIYTAKFGNTGPAIQSLQADLAKVLKELK